MPEFELHGSAAASDPSRRQGGKNVPGEFLPGKEVAFGHGEHLVSAAMRLKQIDHPHSIPPAAWEDPPPVAGAVPHVEHTHTR